MKELLTNSVFFGVMVSILTYELGMFLKRKLKLAIFQLRQSLSACWHLTLTMTATMQVRNISAIF